MMAESKKAAEQVDPVENVIATSSDSRFSTVTKSNDPEIPSDAGPQLVEERGKPTDKTEAI